MQREKVLRFSHIFPRFSCILPHESPLLHLIFRLLLSGAPFFCGKPPGKRLLFGMEQAVFLCSAGSG